MTFPERGIVVAVTSNTSFAGTRSIALKIAEAFAQQQSEDNEKKVKIGN